MAGLRRARSDSPAGNAHGFSSISIAMILTDFVLQDRVTPPAKYRFRAFATADEHPLSLSFIRSIRVIRESRGSLPLAGRQGFECLPGRHIASRAAEKFGTIVTAEKVC
jgi:hypothetical protein